MTQIRMPDWVLKGTARDGDARQGDAMLSCCFCRREGCMKWNTPSSKTEPERAIGMILLSSPTAPEMINHRQVAMTP